MGRVALCSCPAQPALGELLLFTSYKSYYSPTSLLPSLSAEDSEKGGLQPIPPHPQKAGKVFPFPSECFAHGFNGFLKSSIIYRSPAPPPFLDQKAEFVIAGGQSCRNFTKVPATISKLPMLGAGTEWQGHVPIRGLKHLGPGVTRACPHHSLARRSLRLSQTGERSN